MSAHTGEGENVFVLLYRGGSDSGLVSDRHEDWHFVGFAVMPLNVLRKESAGTLGRWHGCDWHYFRLVNKGHSSASHLIEKLSGMRKVILHGG